MAPQNRFDYKLFKNYHVMFNENIFYKRILLKFQKKNVDKFEKKSIINYN